MEFGIYWATKKIFIYIYIFLQLLLYQIGWLGVLLGISHIILLQYVDANNFVHSAYKIRTSTRTQNTLYVYIWYG